MAAATGYVLDGLFMFAVLAYNVDHLWRLDSLAGLVLFNQLCSLWRYEGILHDFLLGQDFLIDQHHALLVLKIRALPSLITPDSVDLAIAHQEISVFDGTDDLYDSKIICKLWILC